MKHIRFACCLLAVMGLAGGAAFAAEPPAEPQTAEPAEPAEAVPPAESAQPAQPALPSGSAARAQFTSAVADREPTDNLRELPNSHTTVYFFTELVDLGGRTVTHRWLHNGEVMAEVTLTPGSDRWRTWSSKNLVPEWTGSWTVQVVNDAGEVLAEKSFRYVEAPPAPEPEMPAEPAESEEPVPAAESEGGNG